VSSYPQVRVVHNSIHKFIHRFYPSYPQVYPQVSLHSNVTNRLNPSFITVFIHSLGELSTETVDKWTRLWKISGDLSTERPCPVDRLWTKYTFNVYFVLQSPVPGGGGSGSPFTLDLLGDLMYLGENIAVAVYEVGYLCRGVHNGGMVAPAEGLPYLGE
jgi:hypothetical protein